MSVHFSFFQSQYPESTLEVETKQVMMHNVSSLPLTVVLKVTYPFQLLVEDARWAPVNVKSSQSVSYLPLFDYSPLQRLFRRARHAVSPPTKIALRAQGASAQETTV